MFFERHLDASESGQYMIEKYAPLLAALGIRRVYHHSHVYYPTLRDALVVFTNIEDDCQPLSDFPRERVDMNVECNNFVCYDSKTCFYKHLTIYNAGNFVATYDALRNVLITSDLFHSHACEDIFVNVLLATINYKMKHGLMDKAKAYLPIICSDTKCIDLTTFEVYKPLSIELNREVLTRILIPMLPAMSEVNRRVEIIMPQVISADTIEIHNLMVTIKEVLFDGNVYRLKSPVTLRGTVLIDMQQRKVKCYDELRLHPNVNYETCELCIGNIPFGSLRDTLQSVMTVLTVPHIDNDLPEFACTFYKKFGDRLPDNVVHSLRACDSEADEYEDEEEEDAWG